MNEGDAMIRWTCQRKSCLLKRRKAGIVDGAFLFAYTWTKNGILIDVNCPECGAIHCMELRRPEEESDGKEIGGTDLTK